MRLNEKYPLSFIIMIFYAKKYIFYLMIDNYERVKFMRYKIKNCFIKYHKKSTLLEKVEIIQLKSKKLGD